MISRSQKSNSRQTLTLRSMLTLKGSPILKKTVKAALAVLKPPPDLSISDWADQNRRLSSEASAEPGQWRTSRDAEIAIFEYINGFYNPRRRHLDLGV